MFTILILGFNAGSVHTSKLILCTLNMSGLLYASFGRVFFLRISKEMITHDEKWEKVLCKLTLCGYTAHP